MQKTIIILAVSQRDFEECKREKSSFVFNQNRYIYGSSPEKLRGIEADELIETHLFRYEPASKVEELRWLAKDAVMRGRRRNCEPVMV